MHIAFRFVRQVEIDHVADAVHVDAAGGDIGRDQGAHPAGAEGGQHALPLALATCCRGSPRRRCRSWTSPRTTLSAPCLVRVKTSARSTGSPRRMSARSAALAPRSTWTMRWAMRSTVEATGVTATLAGSFSICARELGDFLGHGRGEQQGLPLGRQLGDDFPDVVDEAHVEHAVGFVEHEGLHAVEAQPVALHEIEQAAGRGDQHIDAVHERAHLLAHRHAADRQRCCDPQMPSIGPEAVEDLRRQFTRRAQHQDAAGLSIGPRRGGCKPVEDRQRERRGLAGAGLGDADQVAACQQQRDGLGLDRGRGDILLVGERAKDRLGEAEIFKRGQNSTFCMANRPVAGRAAAERGVKTSRVFRAVGSVRSWKGAEID